MNYVAQTPYITKNMAIIRSVNISMAEQQYQIQISVPEELIEQIISKKRKPSLIISSIIENLHKDMTIDEIVDLAERGALTETKQTVHEDGGGERIVDHGRPWTYEAFEDFMKILVAQAKARSSVGDLLAMLVAYLETTSRPTSEELRMARGFGPGEQWYEELRTTKSRLTITAKHLSLPSFFLRAYGSGLNRRHPMDEKVYSYLTKWGSNNVELVQEFKRTATPRSAE